MAKARRASRTPINGLETANQKETFQSEVFELVFTLFSQAFEDRHFTDCEISFGNVQIDQDDPDQRAGSSAKCRTAASGAEFTSAKLDPYSPTTLSDGSIPCSRTTRLFSSSTRMRGWCLAASSGE